MYSPLCEFNVEQWQIIIIIKKNINLKKIKYKAIKKRVLGPCRGVEH